MSWKLEKQNFGEQNFRFAHPVRGRQTSPSHFPMRPTGGSTSRPLTRLDWISLANWLSGITKIFKYQMMEDFLIKNLPS